MTIKTTIRFLLYLVLIGLSLPFLLGYLNMLHPLFDSFAHFRVHLLLGILPLLLLIAFFHEKVIAFVYLSLEEQVPLIPNFKLPIDQVLVSKELEVRKIFVEKSLSSDHFPVVSEIWF